MSDELVAWLRARLDEDEAAAKAAWGRNGWRQGVGRELPDEVWTGKQEPGQTPIPIGRMWDVPTAVHIARHDPARVLREVKAKRKLLDAAVETLGREDSWDPVLDGGSGEEYEWARFVLRMMALPYANAEGYRAEWAA